MVPHRIIQRTFYIKYHHFLATGFTLEIENRQFLVTGSHTFAFAHNGDSLEFEVMKDGKWQKFKSTLYKHPNPKVDVAALSLNEDLSPRHAIRYGTNNLYLSQEVYFLGFPYGKYMVDSSYANNGYPIPFVKKGIFSTIPHDQDGVTLTR
jgi:hypothetical protein